MAVLKTDGKNENKEIEFELKYLLSLSIKQRFKMLFQKKKEILSLLKRDANRKTVKIIKRK